MDEIHSLEAADDGGGGGDTKNPEGGIAITASQPKTLIARSLSKVSAATYNAKKTAAQGMMDIALLTANANQLRYILEFRDDRSANFIVLLVLIVCSLILQVLVGIMLIFKGRLDSSSRSSSNAEVIQLNNYVVLGVFFITAINIFIAAFTVSPT